MRLGSTLQYANLLCLLLSSNEGRHGENPQSSITCTPPSVLQVLKVQRAAWGHNRVYFLPVPGTAGRQGRHKGTRDGARPQAERILCATTFLLEMLGSQFGAFT